MRPWTYDEDHRLKDLCRQGFTKHQIAVDLSRTYSSVENRLSALRREAVTHTKEKIKRNYWSVEEDKLLLEKSEQGLGRREIIHFFPERTCEAVWKRIPKVVAAAHGQEKSARPVKWKFTDEYLQRFIDLRLKEAKTIPEIAVDLNHSQGGLMRLWQRRCLPILSKEARDSIYSQNYWTPAETEHLIDLHARGTTYDDVLLQFPSKSRKSIQHKVTREHLRFPGRITRKRSIGAFRLVEPTASSGKDESQSEEQG